MAQRRVFVLLIGNKERGEVNHFRLFRKRRPPPRAGAGDRRRGGFRARLRPAPPPQEAAARLRLAPLDAVLTEPANTSTMDLVLRELRGKVGLVILSAWGPSVEAAAPEWGAGLPLGTVGTDHVRVGEIQGRQVKAFLPSGGRCSASPGRCAPRPRSRGSRA